MTKRGRGILLRRLIFAVALVAMPALVQTARAAEERASGENAKQEQAASLFKWINFAILSGVLGYVFLKITPPTFRKNAEHISSAITTAAAAKAEADRQLKDAEQKLALLPQEVSQLRTTGEQDAKAEAERLRQVTQHDAAKISLAAKAEIDAAERAARMELKAMAANLAVDGAESQLVKELTPQTQEALLASFVKGLEGRPN